MMITIKMKLCMNNLNFKLLNVLDSNKIEDLLRAKDMPKYYKY